jgi:hypothetical protein
VTQLDERPHFYQGQYLEAADLAAAVGYTSTQRSRILLGAHRWGIAIGLDLIEVAGPSSTLDVVVTPGYAWDGFGRPIVVPEAAKLSLALFASLDKLFLEGGPVPPPVVVDVWVRYEESSGQGPRPGFETCTPGSAYARVLQRYAFEAGPRPDVASRRAPIEVGGRTMDAAQALTAFDPAAAPLVDASVPHQTLPEDGQRGLWLVPLGTVAYQPGAPGNLVKREAGALARNARIREYVGVVAGSVEACGGTVRIHDRGRDYSPDRTGELLSVEGDVRSDGHIRIYGRRLELIASHAESPRKPMHVLRKDDPATGGTTLNLVIGDTPVSTADKLVVGPKDGQDAAGNDTHAARVVVTAAGRVGIGTDAPRALLHLTEEGLQIGVSAQPSDNFHVVSNTDGARALRFYGRDVGAGTPLMSLTAEGRLGIAETSPTHALHVNGARGLRQNALYVSGDSRWSSLTFNAHHNDANSAWVFPDAGRPAATIEMDAIGGFPRFEVFTTIVGDNQMWRSQLRVHGHTGDVVMGHNGGNVGIGTVTPTARLDVRGDIAATGSIQFGQGLFAIGSAVPLKVIFGEVDDSGAIVSGSGFLCTKVLPGTYDLTWTPPFLGQPSVVATCLGDAFAALNRQSAGGAEIQTLINNLTATDNGFTFVALGPR